MKTVIAAVSAALTLCSWGVGLPAYAAKAKFERTKPHVNAGTINSNKGSNRGEFTSGDRGDDETRTFTLDRGAGGSDVAECDDLQELECFLE
jgi:hypothetical protein